MQECTRQPYRLMASGTSLRTTGRGKRKRAQLVGWGIMGWTTEQPYNEARLPGAGSFLFPGLHAVRQAAMDYLNRPNIQQVAIRTNQDRSLYIFNKYADGSIHGYRP